MHACMADAMVSPEPKISGCILERWLLYRDIIIMITESIYIWRV